MEAHGAGRAVVIAGPTASGKSAVAVAVAERLSGVVINADSMQVYADLAVLTARPGPKETGRAPHRLFGHVDAAEAYSVGRWLAEVVVVLQETWAAGEVPVLVGGTGLYLMALMRGLSAIPAVPAEVRARVRAEAEGVAPEILHRRLAGIDPAMAQRLRPTDPQRIVRALEVMAATGRSLLSFQAAVAPPVLPESRVVGLAVALDRAVLNDRIDRRFDAMMAAGALDEVARLAARGLDPALPAMRALGVRPLLAHLRGELALRDAVAQGRLLTRQYAKRQQTFVRHQLASLPWVEPDRAADAVVAQWRAGPAT